VLPSADPALLALGRGDGFRALLNFSGRTLAVDLGDYGGTGTLALAPWDQVWLHRGRPLA
jgi:hypothetical protein